MRPVVFAHAGRERKPHERLKVLRQVGDQRDGLFVGGPQEPLPPPGALALLAWS